MKFEIKVSFSIPSYSAARRWIYWGGNFRIPPPPWANLDRICRMALRQIPFINGFPVHCNSMHRDRNVKCWCICFPLVNLPHKCPDQQYLNRTFLTDMLTIRLALKLIALDGLSEHQCALPIYFDNVVHIDAPKYIKKHSSLLG